MLHDPPGHFADAAWSLSVRTGEWLEICLVVRLLLGLPVAPAASLLVCRDTPVLAIFLQLERQDAIGDGIPLSVVRCGSPVTSTWVCCTSRNCAVPGSRCISLMIGSTSFSTRRTEAARASGSVSMARCWSDCRTAEIVKRHPFFPFFMTHLHFY